ncbi:MAG TPA: TonB-dependent receptor, partial [Candidatus Angelobacter sp.]|nr:TonB-dependent receptor [Candidatus Angelobacter sp.]
SNKICLRKEMVLSTIAVVLVLAGLCSAQSQPEPPPPVQLKPTVIEVTAEALPASASPASVIVLTRSEIELAHAATAADLLRNVPFLHVAQNGSAGSFTSVTVRGGKPNFTLVLMDGVPINDISNTLGGSVDLSTISTDDIERIELVRGPLSSLYASEAVSGVINIISRKEVKTGADFNLEGGNLGTSKVGFALRGSDHRASYGLSGSYLNVSEQVLADDFALGTVTGNFRFEASPDKLLDTQIRYQHDQDSSFPMNGGGPELSILRTPEESHSGQIIFNTAFHHQVLPSWLYSLDFAFFRESARANAPAILDSIHPSLHSVPAESTDTDFRRAQFSFSNQFLFSPKWTGSLVAGIKDENGTSNGLLANKIPTNFDLDRPEIHANGELVYNTNRVTLSGGSGIDKSSGFNPHPASRAGANLRFFGGRTTIRSTWASAFQLPSMFALGDPTVGNRELRPEKNRAYDTGIEQKFSRLQSRISLTYFRNSFTDLIDFSATQFRLVNRTNAHTQGVELGVVSFPYSRLRVEGDVFYLDWKLENTPEPLRDQPHWEGGLRADWTATQKFHIGINTRWVGRRFDFQVPAPQIDSVGGYSTTDISTTYTVSKQVSTYFRIDNIFNRRYHEFLGFPNPGTYARIGVQYRFLGK